jgi:hypothetical protein
MNNLHVWFMKLAMDLVIKSARSLALKFVQKIIGNAMTCAFQLAKNVMESVCQSSPLIAMVLVFQSTSPVTARAMTNIIRSTVKENAFILYIKKKRLSKVDVKVRYRV